MCVCQPVLLTVAPPAPPPAGLQARNARRRRGNAHTINPPLGINGRPRHGTRNKAHRHTGALPCVPFTRARARARARTHSRGGRGANSWHGGTRRQHGREEAGRHSLVKLPGRGGITVPSGSGIGGESAHHPRPTPPTQQDTTPAPTHPLTHSPRAHEVWMERAPVTGIGRNREKQMPPLSHGERPLSLMERDPSLP